MNQERHALEERHARAFFHKGRVVSFMADEVLANHIRMEATKLNRDTSYLIRFILRKHFGLQETGIL